MSDFKGIPLLGKPNDGEYLSDAEIDVMTAEELEAALALALDSMTEETYDGEVISRYLAALDHKDPMPNYSDADASYNKFQTKMKAVYPNERPARPLAFSRRTGRVLLVAVLSLMIIFGGLVAAQALGTDIFGALARWTDDFFSFGDIRTDMESNASPNNKETAPLLSVDDVSIGEVIARVDTIGTDGYDSAEYASLYDALDIYGLSNVLCIPTWIPDGFELNHTEVYYDGASNLSFYADYEKEKSYLSINITLWADATLNNTYSKDDDSVTTYEAGDCLHYIISNNDSTVGIWKNGPFECSIDGNISKREMQDMIDSMYVEK